MDRARRGLLVPSAVRTRGPMGLVSCMNALVADSRLGLCLARRRSCSFHLFRVPACALVSDVFTTCMTSLLVLVCIIAIVSVPRGSARLVRKAAGTYLSVVSMGASTSLSKS